MTTNKNNDFAQKAGIAVGAAAIGAVVGAAATAMADPAIKKQVGDKIEEIKSNIEEKRDDLEDKVDKAKHDVAKKLE